MSELEIPSGDTFTSEFKPLEVNDEQMVQMIKLFEFDEDGEQQSQDNITKNIAEVFISEAKEKYNVPNLTYQSLLTPDSPFLTSLYKKLYLGIFFQIIRNTSAPSINLPS